MFALQVNVWCAEPEDEIMSIKTLKGGRYKVDLRPQGTAGRRVQRVFDKKADAVAFEKYVLANFHNKEWMAKPTDARRLSDLIEPWWEFHGRNLGFGQKRKRALQRLASGMGDPLVIKLDKNLLLKYRSERLFQGVKASTINRDMTVLSGMFNVLIEAGNFHGEHPMRSIKPIKEKNVEMTYLTSEEISRLLDALKDDSDAYRLTILCLSTGARWGEATKLKAENIMNCRVTFIETKNGHKRTVPVSSLVQETVKNAKKGPLFGVTYAKYREMLRAIKPDLPRGQSVHVLRHTFAAHFMMNGGNIISLQRILGHASIQQTMTYAHLAPDYLQDATALNPLRGGIHISSTLSGFDGEP